MYFICSFSSLNFLEDHLEILDNAAALSLVVLLQFIHKAMLSLKKSLRNRIMAFSMHLKNIFMDFIIETLSRKYNKHVCQEKTELSCNFIENLPY